MIGFSAGLKQVLLFHAGLVQHYRVGLYDYLHEFLKNHGYYLTVISEGHELKEKEYYFPEIRVNFTLNSLIGLLRKIKPWAVILFINHRQKYFFPLLLYLKFAGIKTITWTHGVNLQKRKNVLSRLTHHLEHSLCQGIILYSQDLMKYLFPPHRRKAFVANNTLNIFWFDPTKVDREALLRKYGITTEKNIVFSGRITRRKRLGDLLQAFGKLKTKGAGLILVGPDEDGLISSDLKINNNIFHVGPLYGYQALEILSAAEVCCLPGAVGLSIVDAMYCGLPVVTEQVDHGPEIIYLKDNVNGFIVPRGNIEALAEKLDLLLSDDRLRREMGQRARQEILTNGCPKKFAEGFIKALEYLGGQR
ncbi:MAG: glycosyltransferase family 4 protein [Candidatus Saccharicenans sp.]